MTAGTRRPAAQQEPVETVFRSPRLAQLTKKTDAFGHLDYVDAIAEVLVEAGAPFTLGLYGPWGVGKTLVIEGACERVKTRCASVVFDAWRYDSDPLRRHFLRDIAHQLHDNDELTSNYDPEKELNDLDVDLTTPGDSKLTVSREQTVRLIVLAAIYAIVVVLFWRFGNLHRAWQWLTGVGLGFLVAIAIATLSPFAQLIKVVSITEIRPRVVDPEKFTEKFEDLLAAVKKERLVVAIDNLDRCSPKRVTELLETLNTYLEPASASGREMSKKLAEARQKRQGRPDAVFVVAADDAALRRHIESLEASASSGLPDEFAEPRRSDIGRYADEYLRKIFTTTIPIKPALPTEFLDYVNRELGVITKRRRIRPDDRKRLVEVISEGLRRNPRRVSQFVRNLELRLRLLEERHKHKRIAIDLSTSPQIAFVAKLLVLEEEWPLAYAALERDPRRLELWHAAQMESQANPKLEGLGLPLDTDEARALASFLAATRSITSPYLRAFLSLKQSAEEVRLPRYGEFEEALLTADGAALKELTETVGSELPAYANTLLPLFKSQRAYPARARVILETALANETLREEASDDLSEMLASALDAGPAVRAELEQADPFALLPIAGQLDKDDLNDLVTLILKEKDDD